VSTLIDALLPRISIGLNEALQIWTQKSLNSITSLKAQEVILKEE